MSRFTRSVFIAAMFLAGSVSLGAPRDQIHKRICSFEPKIQNQTL